MNSTTGDAQRDTYDGAPLEVTLLQGPLILEELAHVRRVQVIWVELVAVRGKLLDLGHVDHPRVQPVEDSRVSQWEADHDLKGGGLIKQGDGGGGALNQGEGGSTEQRCKKDDGLAVREHVARAEPIAYGPRTTLRRRAV